MAKALRISDIRSEALGVECCRIIIPALRLLLFNIC